MYVCISLLRMWKRMLNTFDSKPRPRSAMQSKTLLSQSDDCSRRAHWRVFACMTRHNLAQLPLHFQVRYLHCALVVEVLACEVVRCLLACKYRVLPF